MRLLLFSEQPYSFLFWFIRVSDYFYSNALMKLRWGSYLFELILSDPLALRMDVKVIKKIKSRVGFY